MKSFLLYITALLLCISAYSQPEYKGIVKDAATGAAVAFVNIGIPGKGVGTVSDESGQFSVKIPETELNDVLMASAIGYEAATIRISSLTDRANVVITLKPSNAELNEVVVKGRQRKIRELGNRIESLSVTAGFTTNSLGCEVGVVQKLKGAPAFIKSFSFNVAQTRFDSVWYRVNIYELDKKGKPGPNRMTENHIGVITQTGWTTISLEKYGIEVNDDFLITLEWVKDPGTGSSGLTFAAGFLVSPLYARRASQDEFEKVSGVGLGFCTLVSY